MQVPHRTIGIVNDVVVRLAHVIARMNIGGTARWIDVLSRELTSRGHEVLVVTGSVQAGETEDPCVDGLPIARVRHLGRSVSPLDDIRSLREVRRAVRDWRPDVVNTHTAKAGVVGRLAVRSLGSRRPALVHTIHGHLLAGYFNQSLVRAISMSERVMASASDLVLAAGREVGEDLVRAHIVPDSKMRVVLPGAEDLVWWDRLAAREALGIAGDIAGRPVVGWLARITKVKRPDRLLEAAAINPDALFLVGGDGPDRAAAEAAAPANVRFVGWSSPEVFWPACDLAVLTSDNEAVPYSLLEASLASLPTVATRVGSMPSAVVDGETGVLVAANGQAVGDAIRHLIADPGRMVVMGSAAREFTSVAFSPSAMADRHLELYSEAIRIRRR